MLSSNKELDTFAKNYAVNLIIHKQFNPNKL